MEHWATRPKASTKGRSSYLATYHLTTAPNTRVTLNATTSSLTIYGASNGSFTITIDPSSTQPFTQTYSGTTQGDLLQSGQRNILASFENLRWDKHEVVLENKNGALLVDMMMINSAVAAEGCVPPTSIRLISPGPVRAWCASSDPLIGQAQADGQIK